MNWSIFLWPCISVHCILRQNIAIAITKGVNAYSKAWYSVCIIKGLLQIFVIIAQMASHTTLFFYFFENDHCGVTSPVWDAPARKHFCHKLSAVSIYKTIKWTCLDQDCNVCCCNGDGHCEKAKKNSLQFWVRFGLFLNLLASSCSLVVIFFNSKWSSLSTPGNQWSFQLLSPVSLSKHHFIVHSLFCVIRFSLPVYDVYNWMKASLVAFSWNLFYLTPTRRSNWNACNMLLHFI